ncbi:MAG TPA: hypothetical protein VLH10_17780 [Yinghuangia sp.]|uniref:hypothetical protein n=1 Tax=Yinghuangia sp. YIM S10712 TaxID=3436930 RepID=UPI002CD14EC0|nr:hypothetical protein [Yinghuangia sp.]
MPYEITVITPDGIPVPPRRADAATVRAALDRAAIDGANLRIRPTAPGGAREDSVEPLSRDGEPS